MDVEVRLFVQPALGGRHVAEQLSRVLEGIVMMCSLQALTFGDMFNWSFGGRHAADQILPGVRPGKGRH